MRIGVPRESKAGERRVGLAPGAARALAAAGHEVLVASGAGTGSGYADERYRDAGARVVEPEAAWQAALVVKVKELQPGETALLPPGTTVFAFQHLVGEPQRTREVAARGLTAIAFELVRDAAGGFPLLAPMSVIAGRLAIQEGAHLLTLPAGGNGTLLAGCPGADPARVLVLGGGNAGENAAAVAAALGARVTLLTRSATTRDALAARLGPAVDVDIATPEAVARQAVDADLVVGAVFLPGAPTPKLLPRELVRRMHEGSVIVDISIDAGGVAETSRPTTLANPTFVAEGVIHYCVPNMPAAVARAATATLSAAVLPYAQALADLGLAAALRADAGLAAGVLAWRGRLTHPGIAVEAGLPCAPLAPEDLA